MSRPLVWIVKWAVAAAALAVLIGLTNFVVDPYGLYRWYETAGFNQQKEGMRSKIRHVKALQLPLSKPRTVLIGSSRVHDGLDPENPLLQDQAPVYNLGIEMARVHESVMYLRHALVHSDVRRVILGLDFFMFNARERTNSTFEPALVGRRVNAVDYLRTTLLSTAALGDSLDTYFYSARHPDRREFLANGFRPGDQVFYRLRNWPNLHIATNWTFLSSLPRATKYYADMALDDQVFADFEQILAICNERRIDCRLYINPAHMSLDGEGLRAAGQWSALEEWKRRITRMANAHAVPLWDFSGYNSVTTETVRTPMKYYWDSSHFTVPVGDWIVARVMGAASANTGIPDDFGVKLTPAGIEAHLESIRADRERFAAAHPAEIADLARDFDQYLHGAPLDLTRTAGIFAEEQ